MKVVGYTRVSTAEQASEGWTLAQQRADIVAECERRGWDLVEVVEDAGYTGRNEDRPGLQRVLRMLALRGGPEAVVVSRLDRLARSTKAVCGYLEAGQRQRWSMVALDVALDTTTATGRLMARLLAAIAEWESEVNGERVREGMAEARASITASGREVPWGFKAQVSRRAKDLIWDRRDLGWSYARIAAELERLDEPAPGGGDTWYPSTVRGVYMRLAAAA